MKIILKLLRETYRFAIHEIAVNRVRTFLSLLGITIGIFSIISVFTIFDSMESNIRTTINSLGNDLLFIQKWPWSNSGEYPWWKYMKRPEPSVDDLKEIQRRSQAAQAATLMVTASRTIKHLDNSISDVAINAVSEDYDKVMPMDVQYGRFISSSEFISGKPVAVVGSSIAENLFRVPDPTGSKFRVFGTNVEIVGVLVKEGDNIFGGSSDDQVFVPINFARNHIDYKNMGTLILVKARPGITIDELRDEMTGIMRSVRKLKPKAEDDFALNEIDMINKQFDQLFGVIAWVGWIIGGFSLLVGGFGIANIMFVSVKERTQIIGIQKAVGAKNNFILTQFLFEAVFLSVLGGILGLLIVFGLTFILTNALSFKIILSIGNIVLGISVSAIIGFLSGLMPAWNASRLDPVEAMRSTF